MTLFKSVPTRFPRLRIILLCFLMLWAQTLLGVVLCACMGRTSDLTDTNLIIYGVGETLSCLLFFFLYHLKKNQVSLKDTFRIRPFSPFLLIPIAIFILGLEILESELRDMLNLFVSVKSSADGYVDQVISAAPFWLSFVNVVLLGPVLEEFLYRGMILNELLARLGKTSAVVVSAFFFAFFHFNFQQFTPAFTTGIFLGFLYIRCNSILPCLVTHIAGNFMAITINPVLAALVPGLAAGLNGKPLEESLLALIGAGLIGTACWLFRNHFDVNKSKKDQITAAPHG